MAPIAATQKQAAEASTQIEKVGEKNDFQPSGTHFRPESWHRARKDLVARISQLKTANAEKRRQAANKNKHSPSFLSSTEEIPGQHESVRQHGKKVVPLAHGIGSLAVTTGWLAEAGETLSANFVELFSTKQLPSLARTLRGQARNIFKQLSLAERAGIGAIAGGLAGGITNATLHPIDTVKTKLQTKGSSAIYSGPIDVIKKVSASQGLYGFYRGLPAAFLGSAISSGIYFGTYELAKGVLSHDVKQGSDKENVLSHLPTLGWRCPPALVPPLAAILGNISSSAILVPKEVIKQQMQVGSGSTIETIQRTIAADGFGGLYRGYWAALIRNLPTNMLNFSIFEYAKAAILAGRRRTWKSSDPPLQLLPWESLAAGALAGSMAASLTTPLDVVKTRLMTQARHTLAAQGAAGPQAEAAAKAQAMAAYTYQGVVSTLQKVLKEEGPKGLVRGMAPRVLYSTCFSAIGFLSFETARSFLLQIHLEAKSRREMEARKEAEDATDATRKP